LGVVFGDIGTSPLYTLKTVLGLSGTPNVATTLGVLSLVVWTLIVITTIKYVTVAMRIDNDGEGVRRKYFRHPSPFFDIGRNAASPRLAPAPSFAYIRPRRIGSGMGRRR
jgi:hypothetical protein